MLHAYQRIPQHIRRPGAGRIHAPGGFIPSAIIPRRDLKLLVSMGPDGGLNAMPHRDWDERAQNLLRYSADLREWTTSGPPVVTATTVEDDDATAFESIRQDINTLNASIYTWIAWVSKDAVVPATRFPRFRTVVSGNYNVHLDTASGATTASGALNGSHTVTSETVNGTDCWKLAITFMADDANGTRVTLLPAYGANADLISGSVAAVGEITVLRQQLTPGSSSGTYRKTEARQRMWDFSVEANHPVVGSSAANTTNDTDDFIGDPGDPLITAARGSFGGVDDYLNVASLALAGDWSFTAIIKPDDVSSRGLFRNGTASPNISIDANGKVSYAGGSTIASTNVVDNQWQIIGITKVGTTITHYLNGVANGSGTSGSGNAFTALRIGYDGTSYYDGAMSLFAVHGRGLTATEESRMAYRVARQYIKTRKILGDILGIDPGTEDFSVDYGIN